VIRQLSIRTMDSDDLPRVMDIEIASYSTPWSEDTFRGLMRRRDADLLVGEVDGVIAGYAVFWAVTDQGELGNIAVAPELRRQGIAKRLLDAVLLVAQQRTVREVFLEVRASNDTARELYRKRGFVEIDRRRNYYSEPTEDALVMSIRLHDRR
jgi:ribosomal-protein-alanine N-acetyltransferase